MKNVISLKLDSKTIRVLLEQAHEKNMLLEEYIKLVVIRRLTKSAWIWYKKDWKDLKLDRVEEYR